VGPREVDRLYGLPLDQFTAARNELARELKRSGDAAGAESVQKLEKPTRSAGAINRAVREQRREAKALLDAASKLSQAQEKLLHGGDRRAVERAVERERKAVDRLMGEVEAQLEQDGPPSESMLERARSTLHAVATDSELREELEAGRITKDHEAVGFGGLTAGTGAIAPPKGKSPAEKSDARRRLKRAEREVESAERALQRAQAERSEAEERLDAANAAVGRAEKEVATAQAERDDALRSMDG
jgi:chromosome segregation ATPase